MKFSEVRQIVFKQTVDMEMPNRYTATPRVLSPFVTKGSSELRKEFKDEFGESGHLLWPMRNRQSRRDARKPFGRKRIDGVAIAHHASPWHREYVEREQLKALIAQNDSVLSHG